MKSSFISGLCIIALLGAGCAATGSRQDDAGREVDKPPQPLEDSLAKGDKKPKTPAVKPPKPPAGSVSKVDTKPQTHAANPPKPLADSVVKDDAKPQIDPQWLPNVLVPAHYPQKALDKGVEGYVTLEFTVTKTGSLQNIVVIDSSPPGYFEQAAMKAVTGFRYEPRIVNGEPVDVPRSRYKMLFKLEYIRPRS